MRLYYSYILSVVVLLSGCATSEYHSSDGASLILRRFIWEDQVNSVDYTGADGRHLRIEGLKAMVSVEAVKAAAEGVAAGMAKGAKP